MKFNALAITALSLLLMVCTSYAAESPTLPPTKNEIPLRAEGEGQYDQLIVRGAYLIDGTGAPATGPVDIVVEQDRITKIALVGTPGIEIKDENRPKLLEGDSKKVREVDAHGKYVLPGFIDSHAHIHSEAGGQNVTPEYIFKLWLGHGVTSIREVFATDGESRLLELKQLSAQNKITAPRITAFPFFALPVDGAKKLPAITDADSARNRVRHLKKIGADGIKFMGAREDILWAALDEAEKLGLRTTMHHAQLDVAHANVLDTSARGLD